MKTSAVYVETPSGKLKLIVLRQRSQEGRVPGILWIHGGGYSLGMAAMVHVSCGKMLAERYGGVVVSPEYRLAGKAPYPAALEDCYAALLWMQAHADELGIDPALLVVGGESAGGGLAVATCLLARDMGQVDVAFQIPLYPMLDNEETASSRDNHGKVWNTRRNRWAWLRYLGPLAGSSQVPKYASPARETDCAGMPPCYTFVSDGEPFHDETLAYVANLQAVGVEARVDVFHGDVHAFDGLTPWTEEAKAAKRALCEAYESFLMARRTHQ